MNISHLQVSAKKIQSHFKFIKSLFFFFAFLAPFSVLGHSVQSAWCVSPDGSSLRIYLEHWHPQADFDVTSTIDVTVTIDGGNPVTITGVLPSGVINGTAIGALPCSMAGGPIVIAACTMGEVAAGGNGTGANSYNNWGYWDVPLNDIGACDNSNPTTDITVSVDNAGDVVFDDGCEGIPGILPSSATTDTTLPDCPCEVTIGNYSVGNCDPCSDNYNLSFEVNYVSACAGNLSVTVGGVEQGPFATTDESSGSETISISLPADSSNDDIIVSFDCNTSCAATQINTAPPTCCIEPDIICPADMTVACAANIIPGVPNFQTNCPTNVTTSDPVIVGIPNCPGTTYTYTFTGTNDCGQQAVCEQEFMIANDEPTITCPPDMMVTCPLQIVAGIPSFNTSCQLGGDVVTDGPVRVGEGGCDGTTYTYTFTGTDDCGRAVSCQQVFTLINQGPTITCPLGGDITCEDDILLNDFPIVNTDCLLDADTERTGPFINGVPNCPNTTYTYTYTTTDACNRIAACDQVFTITNNEAPTITCPDGATVSCFADINVDAANATFTTSCGLGATVSVSDAVINGDADCPNTTYTYTYTVEDACGRIATCDQVFTIENAGPTIACPASATVQCFANISVNVNNATFTTSCNLGGSLSLSGPVRNGDPDCPGTTYTYTYTVTDDCGRMASCDQVFTVDNPEPTITCPEDCPVACASDIRPGTPEFTTSCNLGATLSMTGPAIDGDPGCNGTTYTYTHTVTDACGRTASCDQVFTIVNECHLIDFDFDDEGNRLHPGTDMFDQYDDFTITTENPHRCAQLFDTGHPTSHDFDLGTPNEQYGGPGVGAGGTNNTDFQGNALIVSADCGVPNEKEGQLIFDFACSVTIKTVDLLDMKCGESEVELYDEHGTRIAYLDIPGYGVNSFNTFDVHVSGVYTMIIDLDCGGGVTGFKYCKDNAPGTDCKAPDLCENYNLDFSDSGNHWNMNNVSGSFNVNGQMYNISIADADGILEDTQEDGSGLEIGIDPHNVHDEIIISYHLSKTSDNIVFDITDLDKKGGSSKQQEAVCVYGLLGDDMTPILPTISSLDGSVHIDGNCAEATTNSAYGHDESILVTFSECIDKVVIEYGTGNNSPTPNPSYSSITIGESVGFNSEVCPGDCSDCTVGSGSGSGDDDGDGVCNNVDACPGGDDNADRDGDGIPDACDDICYDYNIDHDGCGAAWGHDDTSGSVDLGLETVDISIIDNDNVFVDSEANGAGLQVGIDPHDVNDQLIVCYTLSKSSSNVVFDITDLDLKNSNSKQHEKVCVFGTLGANQTPILPTVTSLDGHVNVTDNCGEGTTNSAQSHDDESILVEFTECIDKITIVYGTGSQSPTHNPSYSKITIGASVFTVEQCKEGCDEPCTTAGSGADNDGDGVCDDVDICLGFDDNIDTDGDGIPDGCDDSSPREDESNANISLYPNPVYGSSSVTIEIDTETHGDAQIVIMDALGRVVDVHNIGLAGSTTLHEVSTARLTSGVYFVHLRTDEWHTDAMKLVVVKP